MPHIIILLYDQDGNQIGEYHPGHGGDEGNRSTAADDAEGPKKGNIQLMGKYFVEKKDPEETA